MALRSPYVTARRAAVLAGLLDEVDLAHEEAVGAAVRRLGRVLREWDRRADRPFDVPAVWVGRRLESVDGEALVRMRRHQAAGGRDGEQVDRPSAAGGLRRLTVDAREQIQRGEAPF